MPRERKGDIPRIAKYFSLLTFLKEHTDEKNPITKANLQSELDDNIWKDNRSFQNAISDLMIVLNDACSDNISDQRIVTDRLQRELEVNFDEEFDSFDFKTIYYNHIFSYDEINHITRSILSSDFIEPDTADALMKKIRSALSSALIPVSQSDNEIYRPKKEQKILAQSLNVLTKAMEENKKIQISFYGYGYPPSLKISYMHMLSPYHIISDHGKYYLIAIRDGDSDDKSPSMFISRIDLMRKIEILDDETRIPMKDVNTFPQEIDDKFIHQHYGMSYDKPEKFVLKVQSKWLTFLYDAFGEDMVIQKTEHKKDTYQIELTCSPFGMMHFAMQYSDKVEIVSPDKYREEMRNRLEKLLALYRQ
ncbi:MAG: WYL domain-containing protein [Ruminococcus sp.]|nr:WYL domain-containing protein [Ruminococcus sp.]